MADRERLIELLKGTPNVRIWDKASGMLADHLIANGVVVSKMETTTKWIPVTDRLPENDKWVLVCKKEIKTGMQIIAVDRCTLTVGGDRMWLADYTTWKQKVTHWMPLPEAPKGE